MAWDRAGNIYIADGVGTTNRIAKFDKDGKFIRQWGSTGSEPGQFNGVKALAIDAQGNVYTADLGNKRIQVFDADGTFKSQFGGVGAPATLCMTSGATQYLYVSHVGDQSGMDDATIYKVQLDGKVVGRFGSAGKLPRNSASPTPSTAAPRPSVDWRDEQLAGPARDTQALVTTSPPTAISGRSHLTFGL